MKRIKTGRTVSRELAKKAHYRGLSCLRCGKICGARVCQMCKFYNKCDLCGVVCRPGRNKRYEYGYDTEIKGYSEYVVEPEALCKVLTEGLCETCVNWGDWIKDTCILCTGRFNNSYSHYKKYGNACPACVALNRGDYDKAYELMLTEVYYERFPQEKFE